ncbi:DUF4388 domain-containing protein, partial [Planctomycetota bacterium]
AQAAIELNRKSGVLEIAADKEKGRVVVKDGIAIGARFGEQQGSDAIMSMLALGRGRFRLTVKPQEQEAEQEIQIGPLLLEVMRRRDESGFA